MVLNMLMRSSFPTVLQSPVNCGAAAMIGGLVLVPIVSLVTRKQDNNTLDKIFSCYDIPVTVSSKKSLGE